LSTNIVAGEDDEEDTTPHTTPTQPNISPILNTQPTPKNNVPEKNEAPDLKFPFMHSNYGMVVTGEEEEEEEVRKVNNSLSSKMDDVVRAYVTGAKAEEDFQNPFVFNPEDKESSAPLTKSDEASSVVNTTIPTAQTNITVAKSEVEKRLVQRNINLRKSMSSRIFLVFQTVNKELQQDSNMLNNSIPTVTDISQNVKSYNSDIAAITGLIKNINNNPLSTILLRKKVVV